MPSRSTEDVIRGHVDQIDLEIGYYMRTAATLAKGGHSIDFEIARARRRILTEVAPLLGYRSPPIEEVRPRLYTADYVGSNPYRVFVAKRAALWQVWRGFILLGEYRTHAEAIEKAQIHARGGVTL